MVKILSKPVRTLNRVLTFSAVGVLLSRTVLADLVLDGSATETNILDLFENVGIDEAELAVYIYNILFPVGIAVGFFAIVMAGYAYLTSQGQPDKVKDASEKLTSAILGILFIVLSLVILRVLIDSLF